MATATLEKNMATTITEEAVFVTVHFERFGNSRRVASEQIEVDADKKRVTATKKLIESETLQSIVRLDYEVLRYIDSVCLPYEKGTHILPMGLLKEFDDQMKSCGAKREELVEKFVDEYNALIDAAVTPLGALFRRGDFMHSSEVRGEFRFRWNYLMLSTPGALKKVSQDLFAEERQKIQQKAEESLGEWRDLLRIGMAQFVNRLRESLVPGMDGKCRKLTDSSVERLQEFLHTFEFRNLSNDTQLAALNNQIKGLMAGVTVEQLRESDNLKQKIGAMLADAAGQLATMTKGLRKIRSED